MPSPNEPPWKQLAGNPATQAWRVPSLKSEGCDDEVADVQRRHRAADLLDDGDELVSDAARPVLVDAAVVPEV